MQWGLGTTRRFFTAYAAASAAAVLFLPYLVSPAKSASSSYLFGYNNKIGVVLLLLFVAIGSLLSDAFRFRGIEADSPPIRHTVLAIGLVFVLLGCTGMYVLAGRYGGFGESSYEIDRVWLTSLWSARLELCQWS